MSSSSVSAAIAGSMVIPQVRRGAEVSALCLRVATRYASNDSPSAIPKGPLDDLYPEGRMVLICDDIFGRGHRGKIHVYLYGVWAQKFQFISVKNIVQIWGGEDVVFDYKTNLPKIVDTCICLSDRVPEDADGQEIEAPDKKLAVFYGPELEDYFVASSANIVEVEAPAAKLITLTGAKRER
jgi:hypothetical protein